MGNLETISALFGIALGLGGAMLAYLAGIRRIRMESRSINRKAWMYRVIETLVEFVACVEHEPENEKVLTSLATELELLINPTEEETQVSETKSALINAIKTSRENKALNKADRERIMEYAKKMLAHEWELVKQLK